MSDTSHEVNILMYHSISNGSGPTSIPPSVFREQLSVLAECGYEILPIIDLINLVNGRRQLPDRTAVLTFDDGFQDFATDAFPVLQARNWPCTVYLPTGIVGAVAEWDRTSNDVDRKVLMSWQTVSELHRHGVDFGAHGVTHSDLTTLTADAMCAEVVDSKQMIQDHLNGSVTTFAAPFGRMNPKVLEQIRHHYQAAVGTKLGRMGQDSDLYELPRIEMWYFRDIPRWRAYLQGKRSYYLWRKTLRTVRDLVRAS